MQHKFPFGETAQTSKARSMKLWAVLHQSGNEFLSFPSSLLCVNRPNSEAMNVIPLGGSRHKERERSGKQFLFFSLSHPSLDSVESCRRLRDVVRERKRITGTVHNISGAKRPETWYNSSFLSFLCAHSA